MYEVSDLKGFNKLIPQISHYHCSTVWYIYHNPCHVVYSSSGNVMYYMVVYTHVMLPLTWVYTTIQYITLPLLYTQHDMTWIYTTIQYITLPLLYTQHDMGIYYHTVQFLMVENIDGFDTNHQKFSLSTVSSSIANTSGLRCCPSIFPPLKVVLYGIVMCNIINISI